ncbi:zinc finger, CCHC-type containing protein [Tanacetum coccineum]
MLKPSNYSLWAIRMQIILEANGLWEMIEPLETTQSDNKKDKTAIAFFYQALPEEQLLQITKHKTAKAIWDALKTRHIGEERDQQASLGHTIEDSVVVQKLLNVVPDKFLQIVASIEQYSDLDEMSVDEAIGRLKTFEERLKYKNERPVNTQEGLLSKRKNWESSQNNFKKETDSNSNKFTHDKSKVLCFKCKEYGHFANKCPSKKEEQSNLIEEDLEPTLLMATVEETPGSFVNQEESRRVGSENLDGGVTESMSRPGIKEDIYAARTPIGRQSVGSITNQKHDQSGFMIDHNNEGGSNQKNMINLDLRKITAVKVEVTEEKLIYLDVRMITSTTRNQSSSSSNGGFNQKMDQEDLKTYDKAIVIKEENVGLIPICWRQRQLQNSYS